MALCCVGLRVLLGLVHLSPAACHAHVSPTIAHTALTLAGECVGCTSVETCAAPDDPSELAAGSWTVAKPRGGICAHGWCIACDGSVLTPNDQSVIYVSGDCVRYDPTSPVDVAFAIEGETDGLQLVIASAGATLTHPLRASTSLSIHGGPLTVLGNASEHCVLTVTGRRRVTATAIDLSSSIRVVDAACGLAVVSHRHEAVLELTGRVHEISRVDPTSDAFFGVALANVVGSLEIGGDLQPPVLVLESEPGVDLAITHRGRPAAVVNLTQLLNVYG
jgi:hypothetical protein